jgi:hypothetical protein
MQMKFKQVHAAGWPVLSGPARPQPGNHGMTRRAMMATCSAHWAIHRELSGESGEMQLELETAVTIADSGSTGPPSGGSARPGPAPPGPRSRAAPGRAGVSGGPGLTGLPPNFQAPALAQSGHSRWHGSRATAAGRGPRAGRRRAARPGPTGNHGGRGAPVPGSGCSRGRGARPGAGRHCWQDSEPAAKFMASYWPGPSQVDQPSHSCCPRRRACADIIMMVRAQKMVLVSR